MRCGTKPFGTAKVPLTLAWPLFSISIRVRRRGKLGDSGPLESKIAAREMQEKKLLVIEPQQLEADGHRRAAGIEGC